MARYRINRLPKWAREYLHHVHTFLGAEESRFFLREQNAALVKLGGELKAEKPAPREKARSPHSYEMNRHRPQHDVFMALKAVAVDNARHVSPAHRLSRENVAHSCG